MFSVQKFSVSYATRGSLPQASHPFFCISDPDPGLSHELLFHAAESDAVPGFGLVTFPPSALVVTAGDFLLTQIFLIFVEIQSRGHPVPSLSLPCVSRDVIPRTRCHPAICGDQPFFTWSWRASLAHGEC